MIKKPIVYISGPYTKPDPVENTRKAMEWWDKMHSTGIIAPICPHWSLIQNLYRPKKYKQLIEYDLQILTRCDALFRISGESNGVNIEHKFMKKMQRPIFLENQYEDLIKWAKLWISQHRQ